MINKAPKAIDRLGVSFMKVVFHERFREVYDNDPAAAPGRLDGVVKELQPFYEFVEPVPAKEDDILLVHSPDFLNRISRKGQLYEIALLAVGGAIEAARLAVGGEPAFALVRPPGHHASPDSCWGFCWFNNVAVAVEKMRRESGINRGLIVDIDLHFGDGTSNIFSRVPEVDYYHLRIPGDLEKYLAGIGNCDLVAVSAGFDGHVDDWGGLFLSEDYRDLGRMVGSFARRVCQGRVFAVLEGGYNHQVLGKNVRALLEGLDETVNSTTKV